MGLGLFFVVGVPVVALTCVAIITVVNISSLRLPIPLALQILTAILPVLAGLNTLYRPVHPTRAQHLVFSSLHALQGLLTAILAALFLERVPAGDAQKCLLSTTWSSYWQSKNREAIRGIQDAFDCCGFNSLKDRPWPFPEGQKPDLLACARQFHRTLPCGELWGEKTRKDAGVSFAVVVLVGIFQAAYLIYGRPNTWSGSWNWPGAFKWMRGGGHEVIGASNRRLITGGDEEETHVEPYHDEEPGTLDLQQPQEEGTHDNGPRVEPAGLGHHDSNEWRTA